MLVKVDFPFTPQHAPPHVCFAFWGVIIVLGEFRGWVLPQTDFNANARKYVASFMRDVVRARPEHVALVVPVASYLVHDNNTSVKKVRYMCFLAGRTTS